MHAGRGLFADADRMFLAIFVPGTEGPRLERERSRQRVDDFDLGILLADRGWSASPVLAYSIFECVRPRWISSVASPPSSTIVDSDHRCRARPGARSVHSQYSVKRLALPRNTRSMPAFAIAAAAWSCVREDVAARPAHLGAELDERLDQHRRLNRHVQRAGDASQPGERLASSRTLRGIAISPGISVSAMMISLRPKSASLMSRTT
jgi:hypothetical protein